MLDSQRLSSALKNIHNLGSERLLQLQVFPIIVSNTKISIETFDHHVFVFPTNSFLEALCGMLQELPSNEFAIAWTCVPERILLELDRRLPQSYL